MLPRRVTSPQRPASRSPAPMRNDHGAEQWLAAHQPFTFSSMKRTKNAAAQRSDGMETLVSTCRDARRPEWDLQLSFFRRHRSGHEARKDEASSGPSLASQQPCRKTQPQTLPHWQIRGTQSDSRLACHSYTRHSATQVYAARAGQRSASGVSASTRYHTRPADVRTALW